MNPAQAVDPAVVPAAVNAHGEFGAVRRKCHSRGLVRMGAQRPEQRAVGGPELDRRIVAGRDDEPAVGRIVDGADGTGVAAAGPDGGALNLRRNQRGDEQRAGAE